MGGMGEKEKYKMYRIVDESECKRYAVRVSALCSFD